jgi:lysophospholipase L1-like esterase
MQIYNDQYWKSRAITLALSLLALLAGGLGSSRALLAQELPLAQSMSVIGDSISRGYNARDEMCTFGNQVERNWATGKNNGDYFDSHRELLEFGLQIDLIDNVTVFNHARSGATMVRDFFNQASGIRQALTAAPAPRYVPVFLGHNDACTSTIERQVADCGSADRDRTNYCRTTAAAFEREFRRGMDELIQIPSSRILINTLARLSVLCNVGNKQNCALRPLLMPPCSEFWAVTGAVCASLTKDCSDQRKIDMYNTTVTYNEILSRVTVEYAAIPEGGRSRTGALKARDVLIRFIEGSFYFKFAEEHISCCDCFHPNLTGQAAAATGLWYGFQCSAEAPCCADTGDPLMDATCRKIDTETFYEGGFWPF